MRKLILALALLAIVGTAARYFPATFVASTPGVADPATAPTLFGPTIWLFLLPMIFGAWWGWLSPLMRSAFKIGGLLGLVQTIFSPGRRW